MPELPEVETIKRQLERVVVGKMITDIEVRNAKSFIGKNEEVTLNQNKFGSGQEGKKIKGVKRFGKMIHVEIEGEKDLLIHLKMSGQLLFSNKQQAISNKLMSDKHVRVVFSFNDNSKLYFRDVRKFGWIKVVSKLKFQNSPKYSYLESRSPQHHSVRGKLSSHSRGETSGQAKPNVKTLNPLSTLGVDPFSHKFSLEYLGKTFKSYRRAIKILLMDQEKIAGIGNIYANEALFPAGIHPLRPANSLTEQEVKRLYNGILKVLQEGIMHQGSSSKDRGYITITGEPGRHQEYFQVYQREGEKCYKCGGIIERVVVGGRGSWVCGECQH